MPGGALWALQIAQSLHCCLTCLDVLLNRGFLSLPCSPCSLPKVGKPSRSKHNTLPGGTLQIRSLGKDDHGEWECIATNVVASITASTHLTVVGMGRGWGLGGGW